MKLCSMPCHLRHNDHESHCIEKKKAGMSDKQSAFFEKFRQEGREEERKKIFEKIQEVYRIAQLEHHYALDAFIALLRAKL